MIVGNSNIFRVFMYNSMRIILVFSWSKVTDILGVTSVYQYKNKQTGSPAGQVERMNYGCTAHS